MQVKCPNCHQIVTAENINIQRMTAVCAACDTVFPFELPEPTGRKVKRRKVKQPANFTLHDTETLHMEFWTNFRLDQNGTVVSSILGFVSITVIALLLIGANDVPPILPLVLLLFAVGILYRLALTVVNKTHIDMDEDAIRVVRKPLPDRLNQGIEVPLAGVTAIKYEETAISKKDGYDTPRYRVWAETVDGIRRNIVTDVTEAYAVFIAQCLEESLHEESDLDVPQLEENEPDLQDETELPKGARTSQNNHTIG